ncbi:MAG: hypothetical protein U0V48_01485 [Anaerolineales bacterium]
MTNGLPTSIIIFGASGDLTQRKLIPSLFNVCRKGRMPKQFRIIGYGNTAYIDEAFRAHLEEGVKKFASYKFKVMNSGQISSEFFYLRKANDELMVLKNFNMTSVWKMRKQNTATHTLMTPPGIFPHH